MKVCAECGKMTTKPRLGLCGRCYSRQRYNTVEGRAVALQCATKYRRETLGQQPMSYKTATDTKVSDSQLELPLLCACGHPIHTRLMCRACYQRKYRALHPELAEKESSSWKKRYAEGSEKLEQYRAKRREQRKNPAIRERDKGRQRERYEQDINYRLSCVLRSAIARATKATKAGSAVKMLGCSVKELRDHISVKFQPGMSWENWGSKGWHIDHIRPLSSFDLSDIEQFKKACHYTNLQPLWAKDNLRKSDKY